MKILYGLIILSLIVIIHELGHFIAAIFCKVKVESFSVGMGPILLHKKIKGVDWRLSLLPLGGYCGMKGEKDLEKESSDFAKDSLYGVSPFKRILIAFAGPFANLLLTYFCFVIIALVGYSYYSASSKINLATDVYPEVHSAAKEAGLLSGDEIISINNNKITDFRELFTFVSLHPDEDLTVEVLRDNKPLTFIVHTDLDKKSGSGRIGVLNIPPTTEKRQAKTYNFGQALIQGAIETKNIFAGSIKGLTSLFKGVKITSAVSGPASITTMLGETVQSSFKHDFNTGLYTILDFIALISISLFIMNLLPIPVLDGGLILISLIEGIFRINISRKTRIRIQYIGLIFIAFFFVIAIIGDFNFFSRMLNEK